MTSSSVSSTVRSMFSALDGNFVWGKDSLLSRSLGSSTSRIINPKSAAFQSLIVLLSAAGAYAAYRDYRSYISLGPGGAPHNVIGWFFVSMLLSPLGQNMLSLKVYDHCTDNTSIIGDIPIRQGSRPIIARHAVPQRQVNQVPDKEITMALVASFNEFYEKNKHLLKLAPSLHEKRGNALFLADTIAGNQPIADEMLREVAHIHKLGDYSLHIALPPQDCKKVVRAGWGQRHALSGGTILARIGIKGFYLPVQYTLIYSPRNRAEIEVVMKLVRASTAYLANVPLETIEP
ncbi:hypothetical protein NA57DRAFT_61111 [Rhizodiscina lignyota]|uniref:Luciferase domain-containing protein n=1 Tax=Rhizodiscina lignyota TaxID=1504668 RepID=A0A9P4I6L2_9PEZI|nr:hypothetical protein NA57DRAFT_61111 [Rhizodiscina lignyota]